MRHIPPLAVSPPTLRVDGVGGKKAEKQRLAKQLDAAARLTFTAYWNRPDVRGVLYAQHGQVCAYCGCDLPRNDRGDVEHFRPKANIKEKPDHGGYWWLAYRLGNYLLSCSVCNRVRKRDRFPMRTRAKHFGYGRSARLRREARLLFDPLVDPIDDWLVVDWKNPLCSIQASAHLTNVQRQQVNASLAFFKINLDARLVKERILIREETLRLFESQQENTLKHKANRYSPHSLVVKQILKEIAPALLPSPQEELVWLVKKYAHDLLLTLKLMPAEADDLLQRQAEELAWSLAALLQAPLTRNNTQVKEYLTRAGMIGEIEARALVL